ncbi:Putative periplasmic protein [hydrothermal vent metagenome]|uniref:Putative periplasmic protein n=1 Tax=hydrothermal vent metagenome TaxID=652676 RepID=A0A1W1BLY9_9ZZZZ
MKQILKWFSLLFAVSVAIFVIFLLYTINGEEPIIKQKSFAPITQKKEQNKEALWLDHLVKRKKRDYFFPVTEVYIKMDLVKYIPPQKPMQLVVNDLDPYQIFCLKEELRDHKVGYFFKKTKEKTELFVYSKDRKRLNDLIKVLKKYQIDAKIVKR